MWSCAGAAERRIWSLHDVVVLTPVLHGAVQGAVGSRRQRRGQPIAVLTTCILTGIDTSFFLIGIDASVFLIGINATTFFHVDITSSSLPSSAGVDVVNAVVLLCWSRTYCLLDLLPGTVPAACWICCLEQYLLPAGSAAWNSTCCLLDLLPGAEAPGAEEAGAGPAGSAAWSRGAWRWRRLEQRTLELEVPGGGGAGLRWRHLQVEAPGGGGAGQSRTWEEVGRRWKTSRAEEPTATWEEGRWKTPDRGRRWKTLDRDSNLAKG